MKKKKIGDFLSGIIVLMFSQVIVKILGMIYSLYLTNKQGFGDSGNAIYTSSYQIYAIFLTISSIGIPNAVSKLVAENLSIGDIKGAKSDNMNKISAEFILIYNFKFLYLGRNGLLFRGTT